MQAPTKLRLSQTELLEVQKAMNAQFLQNMELMRQVFPDIFRLYQHHKATELGLTLDPFGTLNLVNLKLNDRPVYDSDPRTFCQQQLLDFEKKPAIASIKITESDVLNDNHIHVRLTNDLIRKAQPYIENSTYHTRAPIGLMIMTGCGLGYHLPELITRMDINNMIIFEPHKDSLFASLYAIDWRPVVEHFSKPGRLLQFHIGTSAVAAVRQMRILKDRIGMHNMIYTFVYRHFNSPEEKAFISMFTAENHLNFFGTGFFDDEQGGLSHTIHNLNNHIPLFKPNAYKRKEMPVFVIGNGPSLDDHIEFIKQHQHEVILVSCGTAMASLAKVGIKPDFHIEMERNINVKAWITRGTTSEQRSGVTLLCLNTVSPEVIALFDSACMAKKSNDIGESLLDKASPQGSLEIVDFCNPTVTNLGMAIVLNMGFKEVYLVGIDLGLRVDGSHHSRLSLYQDLEVATKKKGHSPLENTANNYLIPGNFGGDVSTNQVLDTSRQNIEMLLRYLRRTHSDIRCYNSNSGALIDGVQAIKLEDICISPAQGSKQEIISAIKQDHFISPAFSAITEQEFKTQYLKKFPAIKGQILLKNNLDSPQKIMQELNRVYANIIKTQVSDPIAFSLLRGSINGYFTILVKACMFQKNRKDMIDAFKLCRQTYMQFLKEAFELMEKQPLKLDDTFDRVVVQLDRSEATQKK